MCVNKQTENPSGTNVREIGYTNNKQGKYQHNAQYKQLQLQWENLRPVCITQAEQKQ